MSARVEIDAGVCGFRTTVRAESEDGQNVKFNIASDCGKVRAVAELLNREGTVDAYREIDANAESVLLKTAGKVLKGCCAACAVPLGIFKSMQLEANLALPQDVTISMFKE